MSIATLGPLKDSIRRLAIAIPKAWLAILHYRPVWLRAQPKVTAHLAHPAFPDDHWTRDDTWAADSEGWNIYDAGGRLEIERNDVNDDENAPWFPTDDDALTYVSSRASEGSEMHLRALQIDQKYRDWDLHLVMCSNRRIGACEAPSEALWMAFEASETARRPATVAYNGHQIATVIAGPTAP
jgi:hypothetical protein